MIRHGDPPYLECSSRGDKRFSAFWATVDGLTIEARYQAAKVLPDGRTGLHWRQAKGRTAINMTEVQRLYGSLWDKYISEHPDLIEILKSSSGLSDVYGKEGSVCQATELWRIRNLHMTTIGHNGGPALPDRDFIYDIETYKNMFSVGIVHVATRTRWIFEVSPRLNQSAQFIEFLYWLRDIKGRLFGFNNEGFDWIVCQHLIAVFERQGYFTAKDAYDKAQEIFNQQYHNRFGLMVWPDQRTVTQGDLFKIHHFDNMARSTSLKKLEINMRSRSVVDLPYDPHVDLTADQADEVIAYMCHDISETLKFYLASLDQIAFRDQLAEKYPDLGDVLNFNDTKIGKKFFERQLEQSVPGICYTREGGRKVPRQTHRPTIALRDVVSPKVWFDQPAFQAILQRLNTSVIVETKGVFEDMRAHVGGIDFVFGVGGIHGSRHATSVCPDADHDLVDVDVASYYPNLAISNGWFPEHLSVKFCEIYSEVYEMRKQHGKKTAENAMLKLALNGVYGDSGNQYSPFYDPQYMMSITINGQLFLCMLAEWVMNAGAQMVQVNTDGITCLVPKARRADFDAMCAHWETHTRLELEHVDYSAMHIRDVNSYMAVKTDGSVKRIGAYSYVTPLDDPFTRERGWHKNHSALVVAKAAEAKLVHGHDLAEFIMTHRDPYDFMLSVKVPRSSHLEERWSDGSVNRVQNTCRYYVSTQGCALTKVMPPLKGKPNSRSIGIEKGWTVKVVNDADLFDWSSVNWLYYIEEAKKITSWVD